MYISAGTAEGFYDEIKALRGRMEEAGVDVMYREVGHSFMREANNGSFLGRVIVILSLGIDRFRRWAGLGI